MLKELLTRFESRKVKDYYARKHDEYLKYMGDIFQAYRMPQDDDFLDYYIKAMKLKDGMRLLDAGCGVCGPASYFASQLDVAIEAITISPEQQATAKEKLANMKLKGQVYPSVHDFHFIDKKFSEEEFDVIYFLESFVHSAYPDQVMAGAQKCLKRNGMIYIKDFFHGVATDKDERDHLNYAVKQCNKVTSLTVRHLDETLNTLRKNNLKVISASMLPFMPDYEKGNTFYANTGAEIYKDQKGKYNGIGPEYLIFYEIIAIKPFH
ncbi:MAG TPA: class I SAM-dependent methyltransferase [Chitinophagales bacterium]|nr:class I SAM-dependent methyltransferase [Chitinophagales bacterium]